MLPLFFFLSRFISRSLFGGFQWSEWVLSAFARVPCVVACLLVTLAYATCGALALAAGLCFYFLMVSYEKLSAVRTFFIW